MSEKKLPKIADLYSNIELAKSNDTLTALLNQEPNPKWIKIHPYIKDYKYLPIDKIEFLLKVIFKKYRIEVLKSEPMFNGVVVTVRVHYLDPITGLWDFHDGIGGKELQVKRGASAADLGSINPGALAMAIPIAKATAIKDACDHFGRLFGSDLNRKDTLSIKEDAYLQGKKSSIQELNEEVEDSFKNENHLENETETQQIDEEEDF